MKQLITFVFVQKKNRDFNKKIHSMIFMSPQESDFILDQFNLYNNDKRSHTNIWSKRQYAPMYIQCEQLQRLQKVILKSYPDYTIAFDVIFQSQGNFIDWHTDHESLGPFLNNHPFEAICGRHFLSIHFNLTENGGSLETLEWPFISFISHMINVKTNIFSIYQKMYSYIIKHIAHVFACKYDNTKYLGNVFNNVALHCVSEGDIRTSYVVRMIKTSYVMTNKECILEASTRSSDCLNFQKFAQKLDHNNDILAHELFKL